MGISSPINFDLFLKGVDPDWHPIIFDALQMMDPQYLAYLSSQNDWLPGMGSLFAAFRTAPSAVRYVLMGESPYPRAQSANGYAFWDAAIGSLWSPTGLAKEVNRATSLRNFIKMLLFARGDLNADLGQKAIGMLDKKNLIQTGTELFQGILSKGFFLLNASLVYSALPVSYHLKHWAPFIDFILVQLDKENGKFIDQMLLFGSKAAKWSSFKKFPVLVAPHPYNIGFITEPQVVNFFKPLDLLYAQS